MRRMMKRGIMKGQGEDEESEEGEKDDDVMYGLNISSEEEEEEEKQDESSPPTVKKSTSEGAKRLHGNSECVDSVSATLEELWLTLMRDDDAFNGGSSGHRQEKAKKKTQKGKEGLKHQKATSQASSSASMMPPPPRASSSSFSLGRSKKKIFGLTSIATARPGAAVPSSPRSTGISSSAAAAASSLSLKRKEKPWLIDDEDEEERAVRGSKTPRRPSVNESSDSHSTLMLKKKMKKKQKPPPPRPSSSASSSPSKRMTFHKSSKIGAHPRNRSGEGPSTPASSSSMDEATKVLKAQRKQGELKQKSTEHEKVVDSLQLISCASWAQEHVLRAYFTELEQKKEKGRLAFATKEEERKQVREVRERRETLNRHASLRQVEAGGVGVEAEGVRDCEAVF